jgi:hypothetical protein
MRLVDLTTPRGVFLYGSNIENLPREIIHDLLVSYIPLPKTCGHSEYGEHAVIDLSPAEIRIVEVGRTYLLILRTDGRVLSCGIGAHGETGRWGLHRDTPYPLAEIPDLSEVIDISAGPDHALALTADNRVWAWGLNESNQRGDVGFTLFQRPRPRPIRYPMPGRVASVAAGPGYSLIRCEDGTVWGWGYNYNYQFGDSLTDVYRRITRVPGLTDIIAISAGRGIALALGADGRAWVCGGIPSHFEIDPDSWGKPQPVPGLDHVIAIAAGSARAALALREDRTVWEFSPRDIDSEDSDFDVPRQREGLSDIIAIAMQKISGVSAFALRVDGTAFEWFFTDPDPPHPISLPVPVLDIAPGVNFHALVVPDTQDL